MSTPTIRSLFEAAQSLHHQGRLREAQDLYAAIVAREPEHADALNLLGTCLVQRREFEKAVPFLRRATRAKARAPYFCNLGVALMELGRYDESKAAFERAIRADRRFADAYYNLGNLLKQMELPDAALLAYAQARSIDPERTDILINMGNLLVDIDHLDDAIEAFETAIKESPDEAPSIRALINLGNVHRRIGSAEAAREAYARALARRDHAGLRIKLATTLPVVSRSWDDIRHQRERLYANLTELHAAEPTIHDPMLEASTTNFQLAYHGLNDRALQSLTAELYLKACPSLAYTAPHCRASRTQGGKLRVGFVSAYFRRHSVGRLMEGLIAALPRDLFEVVIVTQRGSTGAIARRVEGAAARVIRMPDGLEATRAAIAEAELDILIYPEIGMDVRCYFLAFARLAPVQCVMWGHPDTTGIPNLDWFISSELIEGEGAEAHYSEKLYRLPRMPTRYAAPELPAEPKAKADFGFLRGRHLYVCPQSTLKHHPDLDLLIAAILREDGDGQVALMEGAVRQWSDQVKARMERTIPDVVDRVRFIPRLDPEDYVSLIGAADVVFDTPHWSGGNTSYEAFAMGKPVVTHIGEFMRGRVTLGQYKTMALGEEFARVDIEGCAQLALRLGRDRDYRADAETRIRAAAPRLFDEAAASEAFQRFLLFAAPRDIG